MLLTACLAFSWIVRPSLPQDQARVVAHLAEDLRIQTGSLRFAPDGKQVAYVAYRGEVEVSVVGDTVGEPYETIEPPLFDATGAHVAFRVMTLDKKERETWTLLLDGKKFATHPWIGPIAFSPADGTPAYWAAERWDKYDDRVVPGLSMLIVGKKKSGRFEFPEQWDPPSFSPDGRLVFANGVSDGNDAILVLDTKGKETVLRVGSISHFVVSPDGTELVCTVVENEVPIESEMDIDEAVDQETQVLARWPVAAKAKGVKPVFFGSSYESAARAVFSPDGKHLAYVVSRGAKVGVVVDSELNAACEHDVVDELVFDPSGERMAYVGVTGCTLDPVPPNGFRPLQTAEELKDGNWTVVQGSTKSDPFDRAALLRWSPDGSKLAFAARIGDTWRVRVGDTKSEGFDEIAELQWSKDGKSVWFGARKGREFSWNPLAIP